MTPEAHLIEQELPKPFITFLAVILGIYLSVSSYHHYKMSEFRLEVAERYGEQHYKLKQMASDEILCRDSHFKLCFCGHCS